MKRNKINKGDEEVEGEEEKGMIKCYVFSCCVCGVNVRTIRTSSYLFLLFMLFILFSLYHYYYHHYCFK